jgi:hypothetical protein
LRYVVKHPHCAHTDTEHTTHATVALTYAFRYAARPFAATADVAHAPNRLVHTDTMASLVHGAGALGATVSAVLLLSPAAHAHVEPS